MSTIHTSADEISVYVGLDNHATGHPKIDVCGGGALLRVWPAGVAGGPYFSISPRDWDVLAAAVETARAEA